jgi:TonB family protein
MARWLIAALVTLGIHIGLGMTVYSSYQPVRPLLECVEPMPDGSFVAHFGYWNRSEGALDWEVGQSNRFLGSASDLGQPTKFAPGRSRPFPKAVFKVVSPGAELTWELDGQSASATWDSRSCAGDKEALELPEPTLQKIEPVVEEKVEEKAPEPPPKEEAQPKAKPKKASDTKPAPKKRKTRPKPRPAKKVAPPPLIVSNAGDFGDVGVRTGEEDSFGSAAVKTEAPKKKPVIEPEEEGGDDGAGGDDFESERVLPRILKKVAGKYPPEESGLGRYVRVRMSLRVGVTGKVTKVRIVRSGGAAFDTEARRVARLLKFRPGTLDGKPEAMWIPWLLEFWPPR